MEYISVKNLSFYYDKDPVLENVNFNINSGEFVTLTGENGAAKTTLVKILIGILKAKYGSIKISSKNIYNSELTISYLPQQIASFNSGFPSTVYEFVKSGLYRKKSWFKKFTNTEKESIKKYLEVLEMWDKKDEKIGNLSGGQKQRIIIARMLVTKADILILDEPTTGMDENTRNEFYNLIYDKVKNDKTTVLMVTHDGEVVEKFATKNIHLCKSDTNSWCCKFRIKDKN